MCVMYMRLEKEADHPKDAATTVKLALLTVDFPQRFQNNFGSILHLPDEQIFSCMSNSWHLFLISNDTHHSFKYRKPSV